MKRHWTTYLPNDEEASMMVLGLVLIVLGWPV